MVSPGTQENFPELIFFCWDVKGRVRALERAKEIERDRKRKERNNERKWTSMYCIR